MQVNKFQYLIWCQTASFLIMGCLNSRTAFLFWNSYTALYRSQMNMLGHSYHLAAMSFLHEFLFSYCTIVLFPFQWSCWMRSHAMSIQLLHDHFIWIPLLLFSGLGFPSYPGVPVGYMIPQVPYNNAVNYGPNGYGGRYQNKVSDCCCFTLVLYITKANLLNSISAFLCTCWYELTCVQFCYALD